MNDFNDWRTRGATLRLTNTVPMASSPGNNERVDKTGNAVDRTARAYGHP
ncbi:MULTISPECIES: hypothetical protein [Pseudomonas]|nr:MULTISPECIES: hypothetical protein [Pseudomonas]NHN68068.1 hypothetical protein [Pseudomonas fluorescens]SFY24338.1 hypothetical protein SAMN03159309_04777 [Pseudomonas sp. NFACC36]